MVSSQYVQQPRVSLKIATPTTVPRPVVRPVSAKAQVWDGPDEGVPFAIAALRERVATQIAAAPSKIPSANPALPALRVHGVSYDAISLRDIRPGDIGFEFKTAHLTARQFAICNGQSLTGCGNRGVLHAFVVLEVRPDEGVVIAADGSAGVGITRLIQNYDTVNWNNIDSDASYLFMRLKDARLGSYMRQVADNWARCPVDNFSSSNAAWSVLTRSKRTKKSDQDLLQLVQQIGLTHAPTECGPQHPIRYMMCSEFVTTVGAAAAIGLYRYDTHRQGPVDAQDLQALERGAAGKIFDINPRASPPACLYGRLAHDNKAGPVGYIPARSTGINPF